LLRSEHGKPFQIQRVEGSGGDGGVEAFVRLANGDVLGLQSKYFKKLENKQWRQIDESIERAVEKYPSLKRYIVAVPLDRTPAALQCWAAIERKRKSRLELVWWGQSELMHLLSQAAHHGRLRYWFGAAQFDSAWLARHNATAINDLDTRYTPAQHVRTESETLLDAVAGAESFIRHYMRHVHGVTEAAKSLIRRLGHGYPMGIATAVTHLEHEISERLPTLGWGTDVPRMEDVQGICRMWKEAAGNLWQVLEEVANALPESVGANAYDTSGKPFSYECELIRRFWNKVEILAEFAARFGCADAQLMVLIGPAGAGKSHLIANLVKTAESVGQPSLLLLGEYFLSSDEPWRQIATRLGWDGDVSDLLAAFQYAAEIAGRPALLSVDALNESTDRRLWRSHLHAFAARLADYPDIRLIVSCRDDFASLTLPTRIAERRERSWSFIDHEGFGESIFDAVASYFSGYRIRSKHFPPLLAEFRNPLFLKTFCEAFEGSSLPDGPITLSAVMDARIQKLCDRLVHDIDCPNDTTRQAIAVVAELVERRLGRPVPRSELRPAVDGLFPGQGESSSLYRHLRSNGLLVEITHSDPTAGRQIVAVRFPFERFSEYFIADRMLRQHADFDALRNAWTADGTLARFVENRGYWRLRGLARAMAILVPERFGREFISLLPNSDANELWLGDFLESLAWRSPQSFTAETSQLLKKAQQASFGDFLNALLAVATIPGHPYNANFLDNMLKSMSLPDRELAWTIPISRGSIRGASRGAALIIQWAFRVPLNLVSDEQSALLARMLAWLCSSNHRALRFRATLAAIRLLAGRSPVAAQLVRDLHDANDPYIVERVFAIAAGVAMRERDDEALRELAAVVFSALFDRDEVPPNILARDFGRCVLEIANQRGALPNGVELKRFRPRYRSSWPRIWPESKVKPVEKADGWHALVSSVQPECVGNYGDFGRYVMQAKVRNFSEIRFGKRQRPNHKTPMFDPMIARRWVMQRVAELGWTPERFGEYEREGGFLRGRQRVDVELWRRERIGKKYQWIALHELLGYLSDHYYMLPGWDGEERVFAGPWQFWARDFDPSQPLRDLEDSDDNESEEPPPAPPLWWREVYPDPFADAGLCADPNAWVRQSPSDFRPLIDWPTVSGATGEHLVIGGYYMWQEAPQLGSLTPRPGQLKMWCHVRAWLVRSDDFAAMLSAVRQMQFWGEGCDLIELDDRWLGTYPWGEEFSGLKEYCAHADRWVRDEPIPIEQSLVQWGSDNDSALLPSPRLLELLGDHWSGYDFEFVDSAGERVAFSPRTAARNSAPLFVNKAALVTALRHAGWKIVWAIVGDRTCFDYERSTHVANGEMQFSAVYWLEGNTLAGGLTRADVLPIPRRSDDVGRSLARDLAATV
jgi:hypothetical protein